jgi:hypothetical protein
MKMSTSFSKMFGVWAENFISLEETPTPFCGAEERSQIWSFSASTV